MAQTIVGLYDTFDQARSTVEDLVSSGFDRDSISLVAHDADQRYAQEYGARSPDDDMTEEGVVGGGVAGAVIGGIAGLALAPFFAFGPIAGALVGAGVGAAGGGLAGGLVGAGVDEEDAQAYAEGVRRGGTLVSVESPEDMTNDAVRIMNQHDPVDVEQRSAHWRESGWTGYDPDAEPYTTDQIQEERARIPVVEEDLRVGKREVDRGGVRVHSRIVEEPVEEEVQLREEHVRVDREPVNRAASTGDLDDAFQERDFELTETGEEIVTDKQARVTEEVTLSREADERTETVRDTVRHTEVDVEPIGEDQRSVFRNHFDQTFSGNDVVYENYEPAYAHGYTFGRDERYRNRQWDEVEPEVRQRWESEAGNHDWNDVRNAAMYGWTSAQEGDHPTTR